MRLRFSLALAAGCASFALMQPAQAEITTKDVQVMTRALGFIEGGPSGNVDVAIVFAPGNAASEKDAETARSVIGDAFKAGSMTLKARMVPAADFDKAENVGAAILTSGLADRLGSIATVAKQKKLVTVSTEPACIDAGHCVMAVKSEPKVEITVSKAAAEAAGIKFAAAFRMMITER